MNIFDMLGPVMTGPSSSHTAGAVRIGPLTRGLLSSEPVWMVITLSGPFAATRAGHGTDRALVVGLLSMTPNDIRVPDSFELAKRERLDFRFLNDNIRGTHPNMTYLGVMDASGRALEVQASSLGDGRIMLNKLDGIQIDVTAERLAPIIHNVDKPGLVTIVTSLLTREPTNITTMNFYCSKWGGDAVMVTEVDQSTLEALVEDLREVDRVLKMICLNIQAGAAV